MAKVNHSASGQAGADDAGALLAAVAARLSRLHTKVLADLDVPLTFRQYRTLVRVREGSETLAELAAYANLTFPTISESVEVLVRRGLLTREQVERDRRAVRLGITTAGLAAVANGDEALQRVADVVIHDVPTHARPQLATSLAAIYASASTFFDQKGPTVNTAAPTEAGPLIHDDDHRGAARTQDMDERTPVD